VKFFASMLLVFTALTAVMTYPQMLHLRDGVHDDGDPLLNTWALTWVAHQLPRAPARLFDANIFHPERRTLAFTETLLLPGIVAAPLHWLGVAPLLVHNLVFLSGFIISGAGVAMVVRMLTGNVGAAILGGVVFAFLPYRIDHHPHLQLQQTQCLPFALWSFHRLLRSGLMRDGLLFGAFAAGQVLSCMYYGLFLVPYFAAVCSVMLLADRTRLKERIPALAGAVAIAAILVFPLARAYLDARQVMGGERRPAEVAEGSAHWWNYLAPPEANAVYGEIFHRFAEPERRLFPGFVAVALALVGVWPRRREDSASSIHRFAYSPVLAYALGLLLAFDLSLGLNGFSYRLLYDYVAPFRGLRVPARMGLMVGLSLAVLAGYGASRISDAVRSIHVRRIVLVALALAMLVEYASKPLPLQIIPTQPSNAYADLVRDVGDSPTATIVELPVSSHDDPTYMYYSMFHWQYLVNGYAGFFPSWYQRFSESMERFPGTRALQAIKEHGARYVAIHGERMRGRAYERLVYELDRSPDVALVARQPAEREGQHGEISIYRVSYADAK